MSGPLCYLGLRTADLTGREVRGQDVIGVQVRVGLRVIVLGVLLLNVGSGGLRARHWPVGIAGSRAAAQVTAFSSTSSTRALRRHRYHIDRQGGRKSTIGRRGLILIWFEDVRRVRRVKKGRKRARRVLKGG